MLGGHEEKGHITWWRCGRMWEDIDILKRVGKTSLNDALHKSLKEIKALCGHLGEKIH